MAFNIALSEIEEARSRTGTAAFIYFGIRFATVEIVRGRCRNMVISPSDDGEFIKQLNQAIQAVKQEGT